MIEVEHKLSGTQVYYGYFWWPPSENDKYRKVFPDGKFMLEIEGKRIPNRKVDWSKGRLFAGAYLKKIFVQDEQVNISSHPNGIVVVRKLRS